MISSSELKLIDQADLVPDEHHQQFQLNTSTYSNVNNNINDVFKNKHKTLTHISADQRQSTNPLEFYSTNGSISTNECTSTIQNCSNDFIKSSSSRTSKCFNYDSCSFHNTTQEEELTKKSFKPFPKESALNEFSKVDGCGFTDLINETDKSTGYTRSSIIKTGKCSNKSSNSDGLPKCRTEDQEHAFRQIEDVHNYSKLNRYEYFNNENTRAINMPSYSSNSSNQDDDDDDEKESAMFDIVNYEQLDVTRNLNTTAKQSEIENNLKSVPIKTTQRQNKIPDLINPYMLKTESEVNTTLPDHHARRPMNAFLIFCKRHRGIVKDKYKNYENRSITKILGEWWASLDANDKKCYVSLAKQNKDAFFSANPNFKWYKLPAPSLRTLNTRPGNIERGDYQCELGDLPTHDFNYHAFSNRDIASNTETTKVSYFKLADEKQMGELNNLMNSNTTTPTKTNALQVPLNESPCFFNYCCKQKSNITEEDSLNHKRSHSDNSDSSSEDDFTPKKSVRWCKGRKYQELINSGQISAVTSKKIIPPKPLNLNNNEKSQNMFILTDKSSKAKTSSINHFLSTETNPQSKTYNKQWVMAHYKDSYGFNKQQFDFVSFDLEDKIRRLPAQCLETYLQRKKNTKLKKKINSKKRSYPQQPKIQNGLLTKPAQSSLYQAKITLETKDQIIGSQKRKARKESITRRDITSIQNEVQLLLGSSHVTSELAVGCSSPTNQFLSEVYQNSTPDLLILAEVAANRTETAQ